MFMLATLVAADQAPPPIASRPPPVEYPVALPPPLPAPPGYPGQPVRPKTNPGTWVTTEDYPAESLRHSQEGTVGIHLQVDPQGRAAHCSVTESSGHAALDAHTCALLIRRALFSPARAINGEAVAGTYSSRVRWTIPEQPTPFYGLEPVKVYLELVVAPDGTVKSCRVLEFLSPFGEKSDVACPWATQGRKLKPSSGTKDRLIRYRNSLEITEID